MDQEDVRELLINLIYVEQFLLVKSHFAQIY